MKWRSDDKLIYGDIITSIKSTSTSYTDLVCLVIIDEIHLPHDDCGPVLEAIIARTIDGIGNPVTLQYPGGPDSSMVEHLVQFQKGLGLSPGLVTFHAAITICCMEQTNEFVCLVGLSATLPNFQHVATFLCMDEKRGLFYFDATYWPCGLQQQFISIMENSWTKSAMKRTLISPLSLSTLARKLQKLLIPQGYDRQQRNHHPIC